MIQIPNDEYAKLTAARSAMQAALHRLADVAEARERAGDDSLPWHLRDLTAGDVADAVRDARAVIVQYGEA